MTIQAIIGLGNPGPRFIYTRHNIGFRIVDEFAREHSADFKEQQNFEIATVHVHDRQIILLKPQTFMNSSGAVVPFLTKKGIKADNILVVHDELEMPFGKVALKLGGSARGHNGLKSIIAALGTQDFWRLRFGIGRPLNREAVPDYVLEKFKEAPTEIENAIAASVNHIDDIIQKNQ